MMTMSETELSKSQIKAQIKALNDQLAAINEKEEGDAVTQAVNYLNRAGFKQDNLGNYVLVLDEFLEYHVSIQDGSLEITDLKAQETVYQSRGNTLTLYERLTQCPVISIEVTHVNYLVGGDYPALDWDSYGIISKYRPFDPDFNNR